jgi:hypothetical protein
LGIPFATVFAAETGVVLIFWSGCLHFFEEVNAFVPYLRNQYFLKLFFNFSPFPKLLIKASDPHHAKDTEV